MEEKKTLTDEELEKIIADAVEPKLEEARMQGINIGWLACCKATYAEVAKLTSANQIKKLLKKKAQEADERLGLKQKESKVTAQTEP